MRKIKKIIIHCSATQINSDIGAKEIRKWHVEGNGWSDIGYHLVIKRDGTVEEGRNIAIMGAHCRGKNADSIGICCVGGIDEKGKSECNFTKMQLDALTNLVVELKKKYAIKKENIHGHNEFSNKDCPCFDVKAWVRDRI